jgi:hypothetical protein
MKNVTISMQDHVAQWARVHAARQGKSVSRMIGELLEQLMQEMEAYDTTMTRYLTRERGPLGGSDGYPSRDQLHERNDARRTSS